MLVWPKFNAPPRFDDPIEGWEDPGLPDFAAIFATARACGYSVGLHGSMRRDVDLIAAPWTDEATDAETLIVDPLPTVGRSGQRGALACWLAGGGVT